MAATRRMICAVPLFVVVVALGSITLCVADRSGVDQDVDVQQRVAPPHTSAQNFNELLSRGPPSTDDQQRESKTPCVCGVFLSGQIGKGASKQNQPTGYVVLEYEHGESVPCRPFGAKTCANKCLEIIVKHLPNSPAIICSSVDRDVYKERAHLFVKNCSDYWINTLLFSGKEYCCKDGQYYKCPII